MELGELVRDKLGDDKKAITIFERVLEMDADNLEALHAVADLYSQGRRSPAAGLRATRSCWNARPIRTSAGC